MAGHTRARINFYEDSNFGKSDRRFYEDRLRSGRVYTAAGLVLDLAVVADGIGGESAGERAAEMTIQEVFDYAKRSAEKDIPELLQTALEFANAMVYREAQSERHKLDMGSTAAVAAIHEGRLYIANVGDSRIYLVRGKNITQLTTDHTWGNEMVRAGQLTPEEAARHPHRDDLMHSIGYEPQVRVDLGLYLDHQTAEEATRLNQGMLLRRGDRVVLCTDGLTKKRRRAEGHYVEPSEIVQILSDAPNGEAAKMLVDKALERETDDNVSVIVMDVPGRPGLHLPKPARIAFAVILAIGLIALAVAVPVLRRLQPAPTLPPGEISQNQVLVAQVRRTIFEYIHAGDLPVSAVELELIDFIPGTVLRTGTGRNGYVFIGLPGRAELFIAPESEITLLSSDKSGVGIRLDKGLAILNLRSDFPAGRRVTAFFPPGAETSLAGSKMCLSYTPESKQSRMDCVEDRCSYRDEAEETIPAGFHVEFQDAEVADVGVGLEPESCQFVPGVVPSSTSTATITASVTSTSTMTTQQAGFTATVRAGGGGSSTPKTPTVRSPTPMTRIATTAFVTMTGTKTGTPGGGTPTNTLKPTHTVRPTNTVKPSPTLKPTNTVKPPPTLKPTITPKPPRPTNTPRTKAPSKTPRPPNVTKAASTQDPNNTQQPHEQGTLYGTPTDPGKGPGSGTNLFALLVGTILFPGFLVVRTVRLRD